MASRARLTLTGRPLAPAHDWVEVEGVGVVAEAESDGVWEGERG